MAIIEKTLATPEEQQNFTDVSDNLSVTEFTTITSELEFNQSISGTIDEPDEQDIYTFTGSVGQVLYYDALKIDPSDDIRVRLVDPLGNTVFLNQDADSDYPLFPPSEDPALLTLTEAGTYQLILENSSFDSLDTGSYEFRLVDVASAPILSVNEVVTLSPQQAGVYRISAGESLRFDSLTDEVPSTNVRLYDLNGQLVSAPPTDINFPISVSEDRILVLDVSGFTDTEYSFQLVPFAVPIELNTPITEEFTPGEIFAYTFTGIKGQRLYYDALSEGFSGDLSVTVRDGEQLYVSTSVNSDFFFASPFPETGTYSLVVQSSGFGEGETVDGFSFQLLDVGANTLSFNTPYTGTLTGEAKSYSFPGTVGQRLLFDSLTDGSSSVSWKVYFDDPFIPVASGDVNSDVEFTLNFPFDDTYTLVIDGFGDYNFQVVNLGTTESLNFDTPVAGTIDSPNEQDVYFFTGSVGQRLYYDALKNDLSDNVRVRLFTPSGQTFLSQDADFDSIIAPLTEDGTYRLFLEIDDSNFGGSFTPGDYQFQLLDATTSTASFDTLISGTLSPGLETDVYSFIGTAGQDLIFDSLTDAAPSASWTLYADDPFIPVAFGGNISSDFRVTLAVDETYVLVIDGSSETEVNYSFQITNISARQVIDGTPGRDTLTGTDANETITGFQGIDVLTGGLGKDIFRYTSIVDGGDRITDFTPGSDQIDLSGVLTSLGYGGTNPIADGYVQFGSRGQNSSFVKIDPDGFDGSGKARNFILVEDIDVATLSNSDNFLLSVA
ncbi:type I secretion C-terminal target domain-containing protein [Nostoc sp. TCL26-01]|uniref:type I secretion C-terminal target domain-containing protein n=1 Tax=Nostoc sp. TCL26-01 TaxID=2576904 RepID=UPI0015BC6340|nr:type I secretion C-terminal target domain-containing protein [Nostoc sp. TCL26-01]QLE55437.1 type I secretion C-terminal target domain-containing protein [Nostoc sp. TCL26-01]